MKEKKEIRQWLDNLNLGHPLVIAGPCSAETEEQVLDIAHQLKESDTTVLRAGIWKPRTRPGNFEGIGAKGLKWLQRAKVETGLKIATEVANVEHVDQALQHDLDVLWIGARSTVSPFIVQEIASALKGTDKIVLVKNPVNPDLELWLGAVERLYESNIKNLGVIHRGFSSYEKNGYRNNPEWQIAIDLQQRFPYLPIFLDPSHIAGKRDLVFDLCQTALDLNYDGLMIETHNDPENAWSDSAQQITPAQLIKYTQDLKVRKAIGEDAEFINRLNALRTKIDVYDNQLIEILGNRMFIADSIGNLKKEHNVAVLQSERWKAILKKMISQGGELNLSEAFIMRVFKAIHQESINHQEKTINS